MELSHPPRVLLGDLAPIMAVGLRRVLAEDGIEVVGQEDEASQIVTEVKRLRPDGVVLDLNSLHARRVAQQIRRVSPHTKVVLWARDESVMEVLDPQSEVTRLVPVSVTDGLCSELISIRHQVEE